MAFAAGSYVWVPDQDEVVVPARVETTFNPGSAGKIMRLTDQKVINLKPQDTKTVSQMHEQCLESVDDMVSFKELDEHSILHNLRMRFFNNVIYTNIGRILTAVNPFKMLPIYSPGVMDEYMEKGSRKMPPHVYGVADDAFNAMIDNKASQSCIVSGESGAGKTETVKFFLSYVSEKSKRSSAGKAMKGAVSGHEMQQKILESNPLMEAFGNAKTVRNDNSSRFGKYIQLQMDRLSGAIMGGSIKSYLLEKSRVVNQAENERSYHCMYQLCAAASIDPELEKYNISDATQYYYLNQSEDPCTVVPSIDDLNEWNATVNAMESIGITNGEKHEIINILNAIMTLGNTQFTGTDVAAVENKDQVSQAAGMLGTTFELLERSLIKVDRSNPADPNLVGNHDLSQACDARDALSKYLYSQMFDWIIEKINQSLGRAPADERISTIGVLDIFGFEFFQNNSFEQLCINQTNEQLQAHFNDHVFKLEQEQYRLEGIDVSKIEFVDNQNVIQTIDSKAGIFQIIADELKLNTSTDESLLKKLKAQADKVKDDPRMNVLTYPDVKELKANPEKASVFFVSHYAGKVGYRIEGFLEKNRDAVPRLVLKMGEASKNKFIQSLFKDGSANATKKKALGIRFSEQLKELMNDLYATQPHYVRCVKPNAEKERDSFTAHMVLDQLRYAGLLEVCKIRQMGYPVRRGHDEFFKRYRQLSKGANKGHVELIAALVKAGLMNEVQFQVGKTKVFLKTAQADVLEEQRATSLSLYVTRMQRVARGFLVRYKARRYKQIRAGMRAAIAKREKASLRAALLSYGDLPYGGKHLPEYRQAIDTMNRIEDEERIVKMLVDAIATRDLSQITAALKAAEQKNLATTKEAMQAKELAMLIEKETAVKAKLRAAIDKVDEPAMKAAVADAEALKLGDTVECKDAVALLRAIQKERVCRANLEDAIRKKDVQKIKQFMNQMADLGKSNDPLVHQGEEIVKEKARQAAEVQAKKEAVMYQLQKAIRERNLQALNDLEVEVIELGLENDVVSQGKELRKELAREMEVCAKLNAECTAAASKAQTKAGLVASDLDSLRQLIEEADEILQPDDFQLLSAKDELYKLETQLTVQTELNGALNEYNEGRKKLANEKEPEKREQLVQSLLNLLREANSKAEETSAETNAAVEIRDKLAQLQLEIDERKRKEKEAEREAIAAKLHEATEDDLEQDAAKRLQFKAQFTDLLSDKHRNLVSEASDANRFHLNRYYRLRSDDDFVERVPIDQKELMAKTKLLSRPKPITRSLCRLDNEQNNLAIRINRAILQYCGDLATTFPATLAQYVLVRGLEDPTITDEIYIQLIKHIQGNEKPDSADKAWLLMCMCTKIFPPTAEFAPYLLNFFITRKSTPGLIGNYARLCIVQLDATIELGPTWFKPNLEEIQSYRKRPPILATIYTLEDRQIDYPVTPDMRVAQVLDLVRRKENVEDDYNHPTWGIYVSAEEEEEAESPKERLIRFYEHYNPEKLAHVDLFLDHWRGNVEELFEKLSKKYGPEPKPDDKKAKKGMLSLPITAAMNAVKFLGFANQRDQPPAPETPWPLPWWTHLGDVYFRMTRQKKIPRFVFKRRLITRQERVDKWLYLQAVDDIRKGYLPLHDAPLISNLAALALQFEHGPTKIQSSLSVPGLLDLGLEKYIPETAIAESTPEQYATMVLSLFKNGAIAADQNDIMLAYIGACRQMPVYGMNFFYARHAASEKNYVIAVDVDGIHVLEDDRSAVKRSFGFGTIKKFGATAEYFWMNIDEKQEQSNARFKFLSQNNGINVLLYTLQSWEMYDCVYDATHIDVE